MRKFLLLSALFGFFVSAPAFAHGTGKQRTACTDDAYRFCEKQIPVAEDVAACLQAHKSSLSPACRRELMKSAGKKAKRRKRRH